ncbi:MAG: sensor domain-containing diguanylate cyclase [Nitrospinae bacterium]|nr:sensor domain-containing diguanylate cyclase [Nitrospinota bacterium]
MTRSRRPPDFKLIDMTRQYSQSLSERLLEMSALYDLSRSCNLSINLDDVLDHSGQLLKQSLGIDDFCVMLLEDGTSDLKVFRANKLDEDAAQKVIIRSGEGISGLAVKKKRPILVQDTSKDKRYLNYMGARHDIGSLLSIPLLDNRGEAMGVFNIHKPKPKAFSKSDILFFTAAALHIASMLEKVKLFKKIETEAITDALTGLYSRRYFINALEKALASNDRSGAFFSLALIDVDYFKSVNDRFGHHAGDEALARLGKIILENTRKGDIAARYGGEEFILILPDADLDDAMKLSEKIRSIVEREMAVEWADGSHPVTISVGVCSYPACVGTASELISLADKALYRAKSGGRNRVCSYLENSRPYPDEKRRNRRYAVALKKVYLDGDGIKYLEVNIDGQWAQCAVHDVSAGGFKGVAHFFPENGVNYDCKARSSITGGVEQVFTVLCKNREPISGGKYAVGFEVVGAHDGWRQCLNRIGR